MSNAAGDTHSEVLTMHLPSPHAHASQETYPRSTRITISIEPEAVRMLEELAQRLYPSRRASTARARVVVRNPVRWLLMRRTARYVAVCLAMVLRR